MNTVDYMRAGKERRRLNTLFHGDNLEILRRYVEDNTVDLVYLDPPFQSGRDYNLLFKKEDGTRPAVQIKAFTDTWRWDTAAAAAYDEVVATNTRVGRVLEAIQRVLEQTPMLAYLSMMSVRLIELHRVLKATGSLYLHCDPTASHYLKVVLDAIFGGENFRAEIAWKRYGAHGNADLTFGAVHDVILFYGKSQDVRFNKQFVPYTDEYATSRFRLMDKDGRRYQEQNLSNPSPRPNLRYPYAASNGVTYQPHPNGWKCDISRMKQLDTEGRLHFPQNPKGRLRMKMYLDECDGVPVSDVWTDIVLASTSKERLGYPTQKPLALLERIVQASSNEGDVVLDPFCGCGTTIHAAHRLRRRWLGIDVAQQAIEIIEKRLGEHFGDIIKPTYELVIEPQDLDAARALALKDRDQFEKWAIRMVGGDSDDKPKGSDKGVDGVLQFQEALGAPVQRVIISVKSGKVSVRDVRDLHGTVQREKAAIGVMITLQDSTQPMRTEASSAGWYQTTRANQPGRYPKIQILTVEELFQGGEIKAPTTFHRKGPKRKNPQTAFAFVDSNLS